MQTYTIALVGNPNCGKTTLFNLLTGSRGRVSNRAGVTVEKKEGFFHLADRHFKVIDLPGIYSLFGDREDEAVTLQYLMKTPPDLILNVLDETCFERHSILSFQLAALKIPMLLVLNMHDSAMRRGIRIDREAIRSTFGVPVLPLSAAKKTGLQTLYQALLTDTPTPIVPKTEPVHAARHLGQRAVFTPSIKKERKNIWRHMSGYAPDTYLLHPVWGLLIFVAVMATVFSLTFSFPAIISDRLSDLFSHKAIADFVLRLPLPSFFSALLLEGILPGVLNVVSFFPQIFVLFLLLTLLEDCGYMARGVFLTDRLFGGIGLSGNCFIPMLLGFGCSVPAILSARHLPTRRQRRGTVMAIPFISCSARMPVYLLISNMYFRERTALVILSLYGFGTLIATLSAKFLGGEKNPPPFYAELPPYRMPSFSAVFSEARAKVRSFAFRTGLTLILSSAIVWVLSSFDFALRATKSESMLLTIGNYFAPLFHPLGFGNATSFCAILSGIAAKESIVSVFSVTGLPFASPAAAYAFLIFVLLYTPCMATISVMRKALSRRAFLFSLLYQFSVAYLFGMLFYHLLR